jgi:hypothetical protein
VISVELLELYLEKLLENVDGGLLVSGVVVWETCCFVAASLVAVLHPEQTQCVNTDLDQA